MGKAIMCGRVWVMASRCARCYKVVKVYSSLRETKQRNVALNACQSKSPTGQCEPGSTSLRMGVRGEHVVDVVRIISRESLVMAPQLDRMSPSVKRRAPTVIRNSNAVRFLNPPDLHLFSDTKNEISGVFSLPM